MGQWTEYDVVTGNPAVMYFYEDIYINSKKTKKQLEKEFKLKYDWNNEVIAIKNNGVFTKVGRYNDYGSLEFITPKTKKIKESIVITNQGFEPAEGIMINKITAEYIKKHKLFKTCAEKVNFFTAIKKLMNKDISLKKHLKMGPIEKYIGAQDVNVTNKKEFSNNYATLTEGIDAWTLVNPKLKTADGKKNHKRIVQLVDTLMEKICIENKISHSKPTPSSRKTSCTKRNPSPPCKKGYEERKNKKGDSCCYKSKTKQEKPIKPGSKTKKGCDLIIAQNVLNKFADGKLYYYRSKKKVLKTKEALKIAISMIDNNC